MSRMHVEASAIARAAPEAVSRCGLRAPLRRRAPAFGHRLNP
jgi:hypothetical protein